MKQSTFSAVMANSIKNLLQGFTKGIRFVAVLTMLLTMGIGQAWGATIFNCGIEVNETWYKGTGTINSGNWLEAKTAFNNKDFGVITSLKFGGQYDTWDDNKTDECGWNLNNGIWITITTSGGTQKDNFKLSCYHSGRDGNNNIWKTTGKTGSCGDGTSFGRYTYDISSYAAGTYKMKASWTSPSSQSTQATASFTIPGFTTTSASQSFDNTTVSSNSSKTISFGQHYGTALNANNCVISGTNKSEFSVTSITETNVTVKFAPTSAGNKSATLTITDAHGKVCTVTLSGKTQYVVTYSKGNYGTGNNKTAYKVYGTNLTLADKGNFTRENYTQTAWNTNADGTSGTSYALKANYSREAAITLYPTWTGNPQTVTWKVNGENYTTGSPTTSVAYGSKVTTLPTAPSIDCNGKVFVGWSNQEVTDGQEPNVLFTNASNAPAVTGETTYHSVFADKEGFDGNVDFRNQGWLGTYNLSEEKIGDVILTFNSNGSTQPRYMKNNNTNNSDVRLYYNNTMEVSVSENKIKKITITFSTDGDDENPITVNTGNLSNNIWTGSSSSVIFTIQPLTNSSGGSYGHRKITALNIETDGATTTTYSNYTTSCIPIYTITYDLNGGSGGCADAEVEKGQSHTICTTEPIRTGYTFQGWSDGTNTYAAGATISNVQSDIILTAVWQENTYVVHFDANGGTGGTMADQNFNYTESKTLTANAFNKSSSVFAYWNTKADGTGTKYNDKQQVSKLTDTDKATITLYAQWSELYTVTFIDRGSVYANVPQTTVDGNVDFPDDPTGCEGYTFEGWSETKVTDASSYQEVTSIAPKQDTKLYAVYSKTGNGSGGTETVDDELTYTGIGLGIAASGNATYTTFSDKQFTSDAVYAGMINKFNSSSSPTNVIQIRSSSSNSGIVTTTSGGKAKKVTVVWVSNTTSGRTLNVYGKNSAYSEASDLYNNNNQGDLLGTIVYGTSTELTISGDYEYIGLRSASGAMYLTSITITWETSGGGSTTTYTTNPDCCTPLAEITGMTFSAMTRSITVSVPDSYDDTNVDGYIFNLYNAATGGVATTYDTNDKNEKSHTFTGLTPNTAYHFTIIAKGSGAYCNSEETSSRESYPTLPQYTVTWKPNGGNWSGGSTADKVDTYDYQAEITKPADPERKGYTFNGWNTTPATIMPAENLTYTAQWNIVTYTITYENLNGATHTNPKDYTVETATITLTDPTKRAGYVFAGWYSDANYTKKVTEIRQGSTDNITLYAKWLEIFTITWMANGVVYATTEVVEGEPITPPASPDAGDYCGQVFAGWTDAEMPETSANAPTLYPTPTPFPNASKAQTFYAVFADYK